MTMAISTALNIEDILKYHKGRAQRIKDDKSSAGRAGSVSSAGSKLFPSASHHNRSSGLTPKMKAQGIVSGAKESMVKIDKANKGIKTSGHLFEAADYIARHGKIDLEDENGALLNHAEMKDRIDAWVESQDIPESLEQNSKRPADVRRLIFSCPKGSNPDAVRAAVKELAQEYFGADGYNYLFAVHYKNKDMPNEPEHPHVHLLVKAVNSQGKRLNLRKQDLRYLRERFAVIAKKYGIDLNATSRAVRGVTKKGKTQERIHEEARSWERFGDAPQHKYSKSRAAEIDDALDSGSLKSSESEGRKKAASTRSDVLKNAQLYLNELKKSDSQNDLNLALDLERFIKNMPPVETSQEEILRKIKEFKDKERARGYDIKEKIRQRKSNNKQSQAQKWAIHRKKQNQER